MVVDAKPMDVIALDTFLNRLTKMDPRKGRVVELRVFAGLTVEEIAELMKVAVNTVIRDWKFSIAWLRREMEKA